ncbi:hypothetical protein MPC4_320032 [Methylocella tundrae]|uniref:Uncharacterized protein n=1 Tax=Methylocella tundrae TaxID=227605 RepID=A0A8B6M8L0_METTU|nr:hypothetical protein MPC4_320032 [Methylocella tundrae]
MSPLSLATSLRPSFRCSMTSTKMEAEGRPKSQQGTNDGRRVLICTETGDLKAKEKGPRNGVPEALLCSWPSKNLTSANHSQESCLRFSVDSAS